MSMLYGLNLKLELVFDRQSGPFAYKACLVACNWTSELSATQRSLICVFVWPELEMK